MKRKTFRNYDELRSEAFTPAEIDQQDAEIEAELLEMTLAELRKAVGLTQEQVARAAAMTQSELSKVERRADHRVSTLRRIVEALGGQLEIVARVGDKVVKLPA